MHAPKTQEQTQPVTKPLVAPPTAAPPVADTSAHLNVQAENQAFKQHQFQAQSLQLKQEKGLITPQEQATLGVLQAKMDQFWANRLDAPRQIPNLLTIPGLLPEQPLQAKTADAVIQAVFKDSAELRKEAFVRKAHEFGVEVAPANHLYELSGGEQTDPVTNLQRPEDKDPSRELAKAHAVETGHKAFYATVKFNNLAALNEKLGHSNADHVYAEVAGIMNEAAMSLTTETIQVYGYRHANSRFGFMFIGPELTAGAINPTMTSAQERCMALMKEQDFDKLPNAKYPEKLGVRVELELEALEGGAAPEVDADAGDEVAEEPVAAPKDLGGEVQGDAPGIFKGESESREEDFIRQAEIYGLDGGKARTLYGMTGRDSKDLLTGFDKAGDRFGTVERAMAFFDAQFPQAFACYVEVDVRNLGGLNTNLSRANSDMVFKFMAKTTEAHMKSVKGDVVSFRHGGDEFSFVVVGEAEAINQDHVRAVLTEAGLVIEKWVEKKVVRQEDKGQIQVENHPGAEIEKLNHEELPARLEAIFKQHKVTIKGTKMEVNEPNELWVIIGPQTYWLIAMREYGYALIHVPRNLTLSNILHSKDTPEKPRYPGTGIVFGVGQVLRRHVAEHSYAPIEVIAVADKEVEMKKE